MSGLFVFIAQQLLNVLLYNNVPAISESSIFISYNYGIIPVPMTM